MASFEVIAAAAMANLCETCPVRNLCGDVEMSRMDLQMTDDPSDTSTKMRHAALEADVASTIVLASVYKEINGCEGPMEHDEVCSCGNSTTCGAYSEAVTILHQMED